MEKFQSTFRSVGPFLTEGIQLAMIVVAFFFIGRWIDNSFGTTPWGMIVCIFIGSIGSILKFVRNAIKISEKENESKNN